MDLNEVNIIGRATRDAELKQTPNGQYVCSLWIATGDNYTKEDGTKVESVEFHNVVFWGKLGEIAGKYITKWKQVFIKWKLKTRNWEAQDGTKRYRTEVIAKDLILLGTKGAENKNNWKVETDEEFKKRVKQEEEISVEDIPF